MLRWGKEKRDQVLRDHPKDREAIQDIDTHLINWRFVGKEPGSSRNWCVLFVYDAKWYVATVGRYRAGEFNMITVWGGQTLVQIKSPEKPDGHDRTGYVTFG